MFCTLSETPVKQLADISSHQEYSAGAKRLKMYYLRQRGFVFALFSPSGLLRKLSTNCD